MIKSTPDTAQELRAEILRLVREYAVHRHAGRAPVPERNGVPFEPNVSAVPYAGRVFDAEELEAGVASMLDFWLTLGPEGDAFQREFAAMLGVRNSTLVNSGSSANLVAFSALTSPKLGDRRLRPGDEVITVAAAFPTTVAPIIQCQCVPVFIDNDPITLNARVEQLDDAYSPGKTKAVMMAHTLGNPFNLATVTEFCERHDLWLIEDNCDALGSTYDNRLTGTFGDLSTQSFYPPHHITMGEGGAVNIVSDASLKLLVESFRDWGRDCWCPSGVDNTCNKRFAWKLGELPEGYDHKYIYTHLGFNLKPTDPQAAIGRCQLRKFPAFAAARRANWRSLRMLLDPLSDWLEFQLPTHATAWSSDGFAWDTSGHRSDPSWFGFMIRVKQRCPVSRNDLAMALDEANIGNRMLFGGNLLRQPVFTSARHTNAFPLRVVGNLEGADAIMNQSLFVGVYPGLTSPMLEHIAHTIIRLLRQRL